jgi:hypothetical protein
MMMSFIHQTGLKRVEQASNEFRNNFKTRSVELSPICYSLILIF